MRYLMIVTAAFACQCAAATETSLRDELMGRRSSTTSSIDPAGSKVGAAPAKSTVLSCGGVPAMTSLEMGRSSTGKDLVLMANRPGATAYEGTSLEYMKDVLADTSRQASTSRAQVTQGDHTKKKSCVMRIPDIAK